MYPVPVFSPHISTRLLYVLDWLFDEQLRTGYRLVTGKAEAGGLPFCVAYGTELSNGLSVPDTGLLYEHDPVRTDPATGAWNGLPVIFSAEEQGCTLPFDLFSALFYHLSRYEEYLPHTPDQHGRYPATESALYRSGLLERPVADEWVHAFGMMLEERFGLTLPRRSFVFEPSYDIDIAWSYRHKGLKRAAGGILKDLAKGNVQNCAERISVIAGQSRDPYDAFETMWQWHREYDLHPDYFILAAGQTTAFDKNIHPAHPAMQALIRQLAADGTVGLHPSYYSGENPGLLHAEKEQMESVLGRKITRSRQHYIRMRLPETYRLLADAGINEDFSMGYGTHPGFRAGTGQSFLWYDLRGEKITALRVHPFCFMDTAARYHAGWNAEQAFERLQQMKERLQKADSRLITVFHNFSLGSSKEWPGWQDAYGKFLEQIAGERMDGG